MIVNPIGRRVYPYMPSWKTTILAMLFFTALSVGLAILASGNTAGFRLYRLIEMSPQAATRFYVGLSILGGVLALAATFGIWRRLARPQAIAIDDEGIEVPKSFLSRDGVRVPFSQISGCSVTEVTGDRFLKLEVRDGARHSITQSLLPSRGAFDEIVGVLRERTSLVPPPGAP